MEVTSTSLREKVQRKKYMGEWGPRSRHVRVTMARFPRMVSTYINRMKANRKDWNLVQMRKPEENKLPDDAEATHGT